YDMPHAFAYLGSVYWFGFPLSALTTIAVFVAAGLFLRYHRTGRAIYAIGGNLEAARAAGIQVDQVRIGVFCVAGVLAAIGGLMSETSGFSPRPEQKIRILSWQSRKRHLKDPIYMKYDAGRERAGTHRLLRSTRHPLPHLPAPRRLRRDAPRPGLLGRLRRASHGCRRRPGGPRPDVHDRARHRDLRRRGSGARAARRRS